MEVLESPTEEKQIYEFFLWSVLLKGGISLAEVISGVALFFIPPTLVVSAAAFFLNFVPVSSLQNALMLETEKYTTGAVVFVALYLLSRGLIKVGLVWALLKNILWAYPASLIVLALFVLYQLYEIFLNHSLIVIGITLFDLVVMYFIYREWRIVVRHQGELPVV